MFCPDCGQPMTKEKETTTNFGTYTETETRFKCWEDDREWLLSYDTMNQERVLKAL